MPTLTVPAASPPAPSAPLPTSLPVRRVRPALHGRETAILFALAVLIEIAYVLGFVLPYPLADNYAHPLLDLAKMNGSSLASANGFALTWAVSFGAFFLAYRRCPRVPDRRYLGVLIGAALVFNLTLLLMYPTGAADIFDQIFRARELVIYGQNPFQVPPDAAAFAADPFRRFVGSWAGTTSPYGPVWELLAAGPALFAGDNLWQALILFKLLVILAYAAAAGLLYTTLRRLRPTWALRGLLFFAWNPLLLWETAGNGHNDMVMLAYLLLSFYLLVCGGRVMLLAPAALALATLCKFVPILLLPVLLAAIWQQVRPPPGTRDRTAWLRAAGWLGLSAAGFVGLLVALYAPFWYGPETVGALARRDLFTASIPNSFKDWLAGPLGFGEDRAKDTVRTLASAIVGLAVLVAPLWLLWRTPPRRRRTILRATLRAGYWILFIYLVFGTLWSQPWYQLWLVALTPLTLQTANVKRTLLLHLGGVGNYFVWSYLLLWNNGFGVVGQLTAALVVNAPVLLYCAYRLLRPSPARRAVAPRILPAA